VQRFSIPNSACPPRRNRDALKGQSPDTSQQDIATCQGQAGSTSSASTNNPNVGVRARGAAAGATAGAVVAGACAAASKAQGTGLRLGEVNSPSALRYQP